MAKRARWTARPAVVLGSCSRCRKRRPVYRVPQVPGLQLCRVCLHWIITQAHVGLYQLSMLRGVA